LWSILALFERRNPESIGSPSNAADFVTADSIIGRDQMGGFAKGLAVIEAFDEGSISLPIAEVARRSGLDRATARRCLLTLVNKGYAVSDGKYFSLTARIIRLGHGYLASELATALRAFLTGLSQVVEESSSVSAAVLDGAEILYIGRSSHVGSVGSGLHTGSRLPAYCTALGRVLLSALGEQECRSRLESSTIRAITPHTITDIDRLIQVIGKVGKDGYCIVDQEIEVGAVSIAIPVFNHEGSMVAAINVAIYIARHSVADLTEVVLPHLLAVQSELRKILI